MFPFDWINEIKGHAGAIGLIALGIYQVTQGDINSGVTTILAGIAGLHVVQKVHAASENK